ncbi:hypothetical protein [Paenibacillus senegalimassiliensis]|uniref:hypothetical protein n=1 Tax=Paenibacillus senegalimassiliensis TaxID=1737426 RepID=UPI00073EF365|nr:hypothetical protein [Paenibacillus senegalimassiliensis]
MKAGQWKFNHQPDGIWGTGDYHDTKEAAIAEGKSYYLPEDYKTLYVGQVEPAPTVVSVDASSVLDDIASSVRDECGECAEDYLQYVKDEHEQVLSDRLSDVVNAWMEEFGYTPDFYLIVNTEPFEND